MSAETVPGPGEHWATLPMLAASAERVAQLLDALRDERERRDRMVVDLVDQGAGRKEVATAGRMSPKSVCTALAEYGG